MIEYFNGVLQRLNIVITWAAIGCTLCLLICGIWLVSSEKDERIKAGQYCKKLLIAIVIEVFAMIWLPAHF